MLNKHLQFSGELGCLMQVSMWPVVRHVRRAVRLPPALRVSASCPDVVLLVVALGFAGGLAGGSALAGCGPKRLLGWFVNDDVALGGLVTPRACHANSARGARWSPC